MTSIPYTRRHATFSPDRRYRYGLDRGWDQVHWMPRVVFIGLNPSTADHLVDDPTIRRCAGFARAWGFKSLTMLNLFSYRATDPDELRHVEDPVGFSNDFVLGVHTRFAALTVAAWGAHPMAKERAEHLVASGLLGSFTVLGLTKDGHPRHPLYLKADARPLDPLTLASVELPCDAAAVAA